jgi:FlaA1/EpsC-like NDP-sugar epimerase
MVELSGLTIMDDQNPDGDIEIEIVGLRPGEKLFEELLLGDNPIPTSHPRIMRAKDEAIPWGDLKKCLDELDGSLSSGDFEQSRGLMQLLVKEYRPSSEVVDWLAH